MKDVKVTKNLEGCQLIIEASFNAPKERLWHAYTNKDWFERWWGPEGWETTTKEFDFNPGGRVHYCMRCVDKNQSEWFGQESWGLTIIEEIDPQNSYTARDHFSDETGAINSDLPAMVLSVQFLESDGVTKVINKTITETKEQLEELIKMGMVEGFSSQLNRLESLVELKQGA